MLGCRGRVRQLDLVAVEKPVEKGAGMNVLILGAMIELDDAWYNRMMEEV